MNTPAPEPTPTPAGTRLVGQVVSGRYRIQKLIGEGGMGAVYLAEHTHMRKRVALKLLHAEMSTDEEVLARFRREAEAAAHVEHPNVAAATDFGQTEDGAFFLVLEYVEGTSLRDVLDAGPMAPPRALHVVQQIALALERAHGAGIVHRDLKPENVMLVHRDDDPDFVKVLDFGIAKVEPHPQRDTTQPLTRLGTILGTPEYMAPEQALGEPVGPAADLYAVGVMLYEMLTGKHPFDADDRMAILSMHIVAPVPAMSDRNPAIDVPPAIEQLVRRLLEKDAKLRPPGARALVDAADVAAAESGVELPQLASTRAFGRESHPDLGRSPSPPQHQAPPSDDVAPPPSRAWHAGDSLAKTDYGAPASTAMPGTTARTQHGARAELPAFLAPLQALPRSALVAMAAGVPILILLVIVAFILTRRSSQADANTADGGAGGSGTTAEARPTRASPEEVRAAAASGVPALEALAARFPEDAAVHAALARSLGDAGRGADMLRVVRLVIGLDASAVDDKLLDAVVLAAHRPETTEAAFAILEGPLGARGVEALVDLSSDRTAPPVVQRRAAKSITRADVRAHASPATAVMLDLKAAKKCEDKRGLLDRVKDDGDARVLPSLRSLKSPRGCGFAGMRDCFPCLRKGDALDEAIKAVEARSAK
ncbi:MAG: serine/threonine protein kinase [Labilithrix sp.]|nr:serine/threonine protein kinase [Labilithrix sp.]